VTDNRGLPLAFHLTGGQRQECEMFESVLEAVRIRLPDGRLRQRPQAVAGDKAYSFPRLRRWLRARHVRAVIPERRDQQDRRRHQRGRPPKFDRAAYRQRNVIERAVGWLKERRRIATRYEKLAIQYLAMLSVSLIEKYLTVLFANTAG
jgi:transposase